jgi:hypothetical protein
MRRRRWRAALAALLLAAAPAAHAMDEVPFIVTPDNVTVAMLELARVGPRDFVLDLGSGDGRSSTSARATAGSWSPPPAASGRAGWASRSFPTWSP